MRNRGCFSPNRREHAPRHFSRSLALLVLLFGAPAAVAALSVSLTADLPSPQPVGTVVTLQAQASGTSGGEVRYRFVVSSDGGATFRLLADFNTLASFHWSTLDEGVHILRVFAHDVGARQFAVTHILYQQTSRVIGTTPVLSPTPHPLVALASLPPCASGNQHVLLRMAGVAGGKRTHDKPCVPGKSINFLVGGMLADTDYLLYAEGTVDGNPVVSQGMPFRSGTPGPIISDYVVTDAQDAGTSAADRVLLLGYTSRGADVRYPIATDLEGNLIWYYDIGAHPIETSLPLFGPAAGGTILIGLGQDGLQWQRLREIDLLGNPVRETNVKVIGDQLQLRGHDRITAIHHEALRLPNGHTAFLASAERTLVDQQGPGPVPVLGDLIVVVDRDFQVVWVWNAFEQLDPTEVAISGETCTTTAPGCPPVLNPPANDWTHANSIGYSPADGNLVISVRHLDAVFKVDYANGTGTGAVVWRLGRNGDFDYVSNDPWPWFSHQHDARYFGPLLTLYDNGNVRRTTLGSGNSRGQALVLDEQNLIAYLVGNFDLGGYAAAVGSAELLANGNFHFDSGFLSGGTTHESIEIRPDGQRSWALGGPGLVYRSFRMRSLYLP